MSKPEVVLTITVKKQDGVYWSEVEEFSGFSAADKTLEGLLSRVAKAWEEMGGFDVAGG